MFLVRVLSFYLLFFFKQKTAYEMRISDWSSDVCSSDLPRGVSDGAQRHAAAAVAHAGRRAPRGRAAARAHAGRDPPGGRAERARPLSLHHGCPLDPRARRDSRAAPRGRAACAGDQRATVLVYHLHLHLLRSEEHTSELQSLMRTSYAVFSLKQKK